MTGDGVTVTSPACVAAGAAGGYSAQASSLTSVSLLFLTAGTDRLLINIFPEVAILEGRGQCPRMAPACRHY